MAREPDIIAFKTSAWQSTAMVQNYALAMHSTAGVIRLKNEIETSICREHTIGNSVIDVGIGTGRASLPLARDGFRVTGVDTSAAMLAQCKKEAGTAPIELLQGDITCLPAPDDTYDTLMALNVASHFPNWRDALREWARVVRAGGRIIFDIHSYDHLQAIAALRGVAPEDLLSAGQRDDVVQYFARPSAQDLADAAIDTGITLTALVPYGFAYGGQSVNYWFANGLLAGAQGDRILSWLTVDERMYDFVRFIERDIVARLSIASTPRLFAVFEKRPDPAASTGVVDRGRALDRAFVSGDIAGWLGSDGAADAWAASLRQHLAHPPNRALAAATLSSSEALALRPMFAAVLGKNLAGEMYDAHDRLSIERAAEDTVASIRDAVKDRSAASFAGIDFSEALDYDAMRAVLTTRFYGRAGGHS